MSRMTVPQCVTILKQHLDGHETNFNQLIPPAVWRAMAANVRFVMRKSNVSEEQMRRVMATDAKRYPEISIELVRHYLTEGGTLEPLLQAMHHCGFHPLWIFKKDLMLVQIQNAETSACEILSNQRPDNLFFMIKRECVGCHYRYRTTVPDAKFCPECGLRQPLSRLGLWQLFDRPLWDVQDIRSDTRSANCMQNRDLFYVGELVQMSERDLLRTTRFGRRSLAHVKGALEKMGLSLGMNVGEWKPPT